MKPIYRASIILVIILMLGIAMAPRNANAALIAYDYTLDPSESLDISAQGPGTMGTMDIWRTDSYDSIDKLWAENGAVFAYAGSDEDAFDFICDASLYTFDITNITVSSITNEDTYIVKTAEGHYAKVILYVVYQLNLWIEYQNDGSTTLCEYQFTIEPGEVNVAPCSDFTIDIWIKDLPASMQEFDFEVNWDSSYMSYVGHTIYDHGWVNVDPSPYIGNSYFILHLEASDAPMVDYDDKWLTLTFHCDGPGTSEITVWSIDTIILADGTEIYSTPFSITCNQQAAPRRAPRYSDPVGGVLAASNKFMILAPYLTLIGLVAAVTTATIIVKRRRKA